MEELRPRLAELCGRPGAQPQLLIRFGYGPEVERSPRAALADVLLAAPDA